MADQALELGAIVLAAIPAVLAGTFMLMAKRSEKNARAAEQRAANEAARRTYLDTSVKPTTDALVYAAHDLERRLDNILNRYFFEAYRDRGTEHQRRNASTYTLFLFAQVFGWIEAVRRGVLFHELTKLPTRDGLSARDLIDRVERTLSSDGGPARNQHAVFAGDQRAIGELMIEWTTDPPSTREPLVMRFARFAARKDSDPGFAHWLAPLEEVIAAYPQRAAKERMSDCRKALEDLVQALDPDGLAIGHRSNSNAGVGTPGENV